MATRTIEGTLDTFSVDTGSEVTYLGATSSGNPGEAIRAFRVNPGGTGNIIVKLDKTSGINTMEDLNSLENFLHDSIIGQDEAIDALIKNIKLNAELDGRIYHAE